MHAKTKDITPTLECLGCGTVEIVACTVRHNNIVCLCGNVLDDVSVLDRVGLSKDNLVVELGG